MFRTLGLATDALVMRDRSQFIDNGDYIVQRTPAEPGFWFGNQIIYRSMPHNAQAMFDTFRSELPGFAHRVFSFDMPNFAPPDWMHDLTGYTQDRSDVLMTQLDVAQPSLRRGLTLAQITTDQDWNKVTDLQTLTGIEQGYHSPSHADFVATRLQKCRQTSKSGKGAWFGVFEGALLVADMGIVWDASFARFQMVETRASHRNQGICAALLGAVFAFVKTKSPSSQAVIVADVDGPAGRIYRRAGFMLREPQFSLFKPG